MSRGVAGLAGRVQARVEVHLSQLEAATATRLTTSSVATSPSQTAGTVRRMLAATPLSKALTSFAEPMKIQLTAAIRRRSASGESTRYAAYGSFGELGDNEGVVRSATWRSRRFEQQAHDDSGQLYRR